MMLRHDMGHSVKRTAEMGAAGKKLNGINIAKALFSTIVVGNLHI